MILAEQAVYGVLLHILPPVQLLSLFAISVHHQYS